MIRRRTILAIAALLVFSGDVTFFGWRLLHSATVDAVITHIGTDSLVFEIPGTQPAALLRRDGWEPDPANDSKVNLYPSDGSEVTPRVPLITTPTYDQFIRSIRDLRARGICHVAIRESGKLALPGEPNYPGGLTVHTLVLCGNAIAHEGFLGTLSPDTHIRLKVTQD